MDQTTQDPTDIFDTCLPSLFSIPPIAFSPSQGQYYTYNPPCSSSRARPIDLALPQPPPNLYTTLQANNIWLAGIYLADLISLGQIDVAGKNIAELGAGAGLPGIVACRDGSARQVVSSDWGVEEVLSVLRGNFERACGGVGDDGQGDHNEGKKADGEGGEGAEQRQRRQIRTGRRWNVVGHQWGEDTAPLLRALNPDFDVDFDPSSNETPKETGFDILLLADVLWATDAHPALLDSIESLLHPRGIVHITAGLHTGRGPIDRFVSRAEGRGWNVDRKAEVRWRIEGGWDEYDETMRVGNEEERGVVVYLTLSKVRSDGRTGA